MYETIVKPVLTYGAEYWQLAASNNLSTDCDVGDCRKIR